MTVQMSRDDLSFWVSTPDPLPCPKLQGEVHADVAIVGGGFAGLSAAYHLIRERPELDIVLLDAHCIGSGASGRNTGILRPGVGGTVLDLCRRYGETVARELYQASSEAVAQVRRIIRDEQLECELEDAPHVKLALTTGQARRLRQEADMLARLGFEAEYFDAAAMAARAPVRSCGGLCYPQSGQLNPARLSRELKRIVIERGVRVYEQTPVASITPGEPVRLDLPHGVLAAQQVVLATNAYTAQLGLLAGQVIPLQTHVSLTEPLTDAQLSRLVWEGRRSFSDKRHIFNYYRLTPDNRIMFGGGRPLYRAAKDNAAAGAADIAEPTVWREQRAAFARTFPALADVAIVRQWSGTLGMTLDQLPMMGELPQAPGVFFVGGWSGHGVGTATASGALIADLLAGRASWQTTLPWKRSRTSRLPGDPLRTIALSAYLTGLQWADQLEALLDRLRSSDQ